MTQQETAVGGANDTVVAAEPTLQDRFAAVSGDEQEKEPEEEQADDAPASETELTEEDVAELEPDAEAEADAPAIQPPVSWTAEEKEEFNQLPRALQETLTRREAEREKFVQSKAREAAKTRLTVEQQAAEWRATKLQADAQLLQEMLPEIPQKPSHLLQVDSPYEYAQQMEWHENAVAQHNAIVQRYDAIHAEISQVQQTMQRQAQELDQQTLKNQFPDFLDAEKGPELKKTLTSTALALGYSDDQLANVDAQDILAMKQASEWKAKADKFDTLMAKKMETVREAKNLPRVSRPGTPQRGAAANERYQADRQAMRKGDKEAGIRVFSKFI